MAKITAGLTRKRPGQKQFASDGFHLSVEVETDITTPEEFAERVHTLFAEIESALDREIAERSPQQTYPTSRRDFWAAGSGGNGGNGHGGNGGHTAPQERDRSHGNTNPSGGNGGQTQTQTVAVTPQAPAQQPADGAAPCTPKQAQFLFKLARKAGMTTQSELNGWIGTSLGVAGKTVYQLTRAEASKAIDILNGKEAAPR